MKEAFELIFNDKAIHNYDEWKNEYLLTDPKHWREGRSAQALANFIMNKNGLDTIIERVNSILKKNTEEKIISLSKGIIEYESKFDNYRGNGRIHDLGLWGETQNKRVFIGIESKVDEPFGLPLKDALYKAERELEKSKNSKKVQRIDDLVFKYFGKYSKDIMNFRYQLFYALAGTEIDLRCKIDTNIKILLIINFKNDSYDKRIGESNKQDYLDFMNNVKELSKLGELSYFKFNRKGNVQIYVDYLEI